MTSTEKTAITRIVVDLIKADSIIDISEMDFFAKIEEKYRISTENIIAAQKMDFGEAVNTLKELPKNEILDIIEYFKSLTMVDGECAPEEAFLILALHFCLNPNTKTNAQLISTKVTNISIEQKNIIYTETEYDEEINEIFSDKNRLRYIINDFNVAGLNFVYIPQVTEDFKTMDDDYLNNVIRFLAPSLNEEESNNVFNTLRSIKTKEFCDNFLINKMGLEKLYDTDPSILFQVCRSDNNIVYLQIPLSEDVQEDLIEFVDFYKTVTKYSAKVHRHIANSQRFVYHGFHRSLFDILAFPGNNVESRILIDLNKRQLTFIDLNKVLPLHIKQLAVYIFIIQQSICSRAHELSLEPSSEAKKKANQKAFERIYGSMSDSDVSDYAEGITPILSHIKKAIKEIEYLDNVKAYLPERVDGTLKVKIQPSKVLVVEDGKSIPMTESKFWTSL